MHILFWRYTKMKPWNEKLGRYEIERVVIEIDLFNPLLKTVIFDCWHHTLPLAEQALKASYPGIEYRRVCGYPPGKNESWSGIEA